MQKILFLSLVALISFFQYQLWFGRSGIYNSHILSHAINSQELTNQKLHNRNDVLVAKINSLKGSPLAFEARARNELGLIKPGETLVILPGNNLKVTR